MPKPADRLPRDLPRLLRETQETLLSLFRPLIAEAGLTEPQWRILRALSVETEMEPRQISRACQMLGPSLTGVLARMERAGLILRERVDSDQRRIRVRLSPQAHEIVTRLAPRIEARYRAFEAALGGETAQALNDALDQAARLDISALMRTASSQDPEK